MSGNPRIDGAEKRWKAYRNDLTEYVVKDAKQGEKVLVEAPIGNLEFEILSID